MDEQDKLLAEFEYWLEKEGIDLPSERRQAALADFADVRRHVGAVDRAVMIIADAEPSSEYVLRSATTNA